MTSAVTSRPTHYATLGLEPGATEDQIQRAFAREMSAIRPRAFGGIAEVSIAYEVLRDPVRRKAYDESIGIAPKPEAPAKVQWQASPYLLRASARPSPAAAPVTIAVLPVKLTAGTSSSSPGCRAYSRICSCSRQALSEQC